MEDGLPGGDGGQGAVVQRGQRLAGLSARPSTTTTLSVRQSVPSSTWDTIRDHPSTSVTNIAPNITPTLLYDEYPQYSVLSTQYSLFCLMTRLLLYAGHQGQTRHPAMVTIRQAVSMPSMHPSSKVSPSISSWTTWSLLVQQYLLSRPPQQKMLMLSSLTGQ